MPPSPERAAYGAAMERLSAFHRGLGAGPLSPAQLAERERLFADAERAKEVWARTNEYKERMAETKRYFSAQ